MSRHTGPTGNRTRGRQKDTAPDLDISSLIDVSFLLLIYFVVTSTLSPAEGDLSLIMGPPPVPGNSEKAPDFDPPTIALNEAGVIFLGNEMLDIDVSQHKLVLLLDRLNSYTKATRLINPGKQTKVNFKVSDGATGQRFIDVMNCLAEVGISDVIFQDLE